MKLANFLATHRSGICKVRRWIAVIFAGGCAVYARQHDNTFGRSLFYSLLLAICVYAAACCIDRIIGILSPITIDLSKVKGISVYHDETHLHIENEAFKIKAFERFDKQIDSFEVQEKIVGKNGDEMMKTLYTALTGENCLLYDGKNEYKIDAGLARHLLTILNCHAEAKKACKGLSFLA